MPCHSSNRASFALKQEQERQAHACLLSHPRAAKLQLPNSIASSFQLSLTFLAIGTCAGCFLVKYHVDMLVVTRLYHAHEMYPHTPQPKRILSVQAPASSSSVTVHLNHQPPAFSVSQSGVEPHACRHAAHQIPSCLHFPVQMPKAWRISQPPRCMLTRCRWITVARLATALPSGHATVQHRATTPAHA